MEKLFAILHVESWTEFWWVAFGLFGQLMFTGRFLVQWIASERAKRSVVPVIFWYFSLAGGVILLDRPAMVAAAEVAGLFLWAREP